MMDDEQRSAKTDEASDHEPDKEDESCCDVFPFMQLPDDMRARALEYLLSASEACHDPWASAKRVPYSAAASLDTLLFHARDIKTVCKAIATAVRIMERRISKPTAWLEGIWGITNPNYGARKQRSRADVLEDCRERAQIAAHANLVVEMCERLTLACDESRDMFVQMPKGWSDKRKGAVTKQVRVRSQESWAHIRVRSQEEVKRVSPIERIALENVLDSTAENFGRFFAQHSWTLRVTSVSLVYRGATEGGELVDADDAAYDEVDARLEQFFGAETLRSEHWIQAWANGGEDGGSTMTLESAREHPSWGHDWSRPPVTRIRDVRYGRRHYNGRKPDTIALTDDGSDYVPIQYIGTVDIRFKQDARASPQAPGDDEDPEKPSAPPYYFIGPVSSVQWKGRARVKTSAVFKVNSTALEEGLLFVGLVPGVFDVQLDCCVAGLS